MFTYPELDTFIMILRVVILLMSLPQSLALRNCSNNLAKFRLCSLVPLYDRSGLPEPYPGQITTSVTLYSVAELDDVIQTIKIELLLAVSWIDNRVSIDDEVSEWYNPDTEEAKNLFFPTIKFNRAKAIHREVLYGPNDEHFFWFERKTQRFEYQQSMKVTIYCQFDFTNFPYDSHDCYLTFGDASNSMEYLHLLPPKIQVNGRDHAFEAEVKLNQSKLPFDILVSSHDSYPHYEAGYNYSYTGVKFHMKRNGLGLLVGSFYVPTLIFTCLSLISFSIHPDVVPGRLGLLITLYLIASNVYNSVQGPPSRGFSYLEVWMVGIHIPMLTAIFEYGFLLAIKKKFLKVRNIGSIDNFCDKVDLITLYLSSLFIVFFNLTYWLVARSL